MSKNYNRKILGGIENIYPRGQYYICSQFGKAIMQPIIIKHSTRYVHSYQHNQRHLYHKSWRKKHSLWSSNLWIQINV